MSSERCLPGNWTLPVLIFLGTLLLQLAWVFAVPPFRGMDEFDHAYRAAAVAGGHWSAESAPSVYVGRGDLVRAPRSLVAAAKPICDSYPWISAADCAPSRDYRDGTVSIASGAARYNPLFYWLVGTIARPFEGAQALYAMRAFSSVACALLVAMASRCLLLWSRTQWPLLALVVSLTPMTLYSGSTPAPNGPEMFAGLLVWCAGLGLRNVAPDDQRTTSLLVMGTLGALILGVVRSLGPVWLLLIAITVLSFLGWARAMELARRRARLCAATVGTIVVATTASLGWTLHSGANSTARLLDRHLQSPVANSFRLAPVWLLQAIGAFPNKVDPAPSLVYGVGVCLFAGAILICYRSARAKLRVHLVAVMILTLGVQLTISALTFSHVGPAWQGRYILPFALGVLVLGSMGLDEAATPMKRMFLPVVFACLAIEHGASPLAVLSREQATGLLPAAAVWIGGHDLVVGALVATGILMWFAAVGMSPAHIRGLKAVRTQGAKRRRLLVWPPQVKAGTAPTRGLEAAE